MRLAVAAGGAFVLRYIRPALISTTIFLAGCGVGVDVDDYTPLSSGLTGENLYSEACAKCHGDRGQGKYGVYGLSWFIWELTGTPKIPENISVSDFITVVKSGKHHHKKTDMPSFQNIHEDQIELIANFLLSNN